MEKQREEGENCQVQQGRSRRQMGAVPSRDVSHSSCTRQAVKGAGVLAASCHESRDSGMELPTWDRAIRPSVGPLQGIVTTRYVTSLSVLPSVAQVCSPGAASLTSPFSPWTLPRLRPRKGDWWPLAWRCKVKGRRGRGRSRNFRKWLFFKALVSLASSMCSY